ncbi:MAG: hypothetical protein JJ921_10405 [Pseudomonadales bacterium]|nr:hypothetical protein [Pseudomonadales bacterium]MBO7004642.1 hypothetical protein [Pseudomonadales bacterium]
MVTKVLFHRQYDRYSGGQQKVLDYFEHCLAHPELEPYISWGDQSAPIETTPWQPFKNRAITDFRPNNFDLVFLAGMDWKEYLDRKAEDQPVINLIQHVRHANPEANVYPYLSEAATRICVSEEVKQAIDGTNRVNGRTIAIPNGIDTGYLDKFVKSPTTNSVYILGLKQPELAKELESALSQRFEIICHTDHVPRNQVLDSMASSEITILLPHATEGFFLPALEAMLLSKLVVVPDCVGNRSFCVDGINCLMPDLDKGLLLAAVHSASGLLRSDGAKKLQKAARETVEAHTLKRERDAFFKLLSAIGIL